MTLEGAVMTGEAEFTRRTEPFRKELLAHCYRMLASVHEAEDVVQETYLRAWRSYSAFEGRSSLRVWLYRIATNACLTALDQRGRRALPSGLGAPATDLAPGPPAEAGTVFVEPIADSLVVAESADPATIVTMRESLRLALIAALQYLPAKQRAVLILREVLGFPAAEVATMLDTSVAAVKSTLQRARARLDEAAPAGEIPAPTDPRAQALLTDYIAGFENADIAALERALRTDAAIEMVGTPTWFSGRELCLRVLNDAVGSPGDWRMIPIVANGQPAVGSYRRTPGGFEPFGIAVLTPTPTGLTHIHVFSDPGLVTLFGLPPTAG